MTQTVPLALLRHLVSVVGLRPATSLAEAQAAAYSDGRMRHAGMKVSAETFNAPYAMGISYPLVSVLGIFAAIGSLWLPLPTLLLACWLTLLALGDASGLSLPPLTTFRNSQNIVGTRASEKHTRWRVVLLAPLDTPLDTRMQRQPHGQRYMVGRIIASSLIALLAFFVLISPQYPWWYGQIIPTLYLVVTLLPRRTTDEHGLGDSSALAVLLAVAAELGTLRSVEVWTVALGAANTGPYGVKNLLARYPFPPAETLFVALERMDCEQLAYTSREGVFAQHATDSLLTHLVETSIQDIATDSRPIVPCIYRAPVSLASPLQARGYRVITLLTRGSRCIQYDEDGDISDGVRAHRLHQATQLLLHLVKHLDNDSR